MPNPWMKKNPALSLILTGASTATSHGRGLLLRQVRANRTTTIKAMTKVWIGLWAPKPTRRRTSAR
jgi:hypothetical protein